MSADKHSHLPNPLDAADVLSSVGQAAYVWDIASDFIAWSGNAPDVLKVKDAVPGSGAAFAQLADAGKAASRYDTVVKSEKKDSGSGVPYQIEYLFRPGKDSHLRLWVEDTGRWFAGPDGKPARAQGVVRVINERHEREQRLTFLAQCDGLTGELNRWHLSETLLTTLDEATRSRGSCGFLLISVDHLARLNEAYGYGIIDEMISAVAARLRSRLRGADSLGRYSGNKFGVILNKCTPDELQVAAERLLAGIREEMIPTRLGPVAVTITIGGVSAPRHARTVEEIFARAQDALMDAKAKRPGSFLAYRPNPERDARRKESVRATDEIVAALNERRIELAFEPVVDANSRSPAFYESLMRVRRADGSLAATHEIIPVAERVGLVRMLDHRALQLIVDELVAAPHLCASVNVSPASILDPDWWSGLEAMLRRHTGIAGRLTIEITETSAIQDVDDTRGFVMRAKDLGCRVAIDDFGAGYTSFRNLRKLGVDLVKIDGAFVQNITRSADDRAFVQMLIELSRKLNIKTVAEWVQDAPAAEMLAAWGCDYLQGKYAGLASLERPWTAAPADTRAAG